MKISWFYAFLSLIVAVALAWQAYDIANDEKNNLDTLVAIDYPWRRNSLKTGEYKGEYQPKGVERSHVCSHARCEFLFRRFWRKDAVVSCNYCVLACDTSWRGKKHSQRERCLNTINNLQRKCRGA